MAVLDREIAKRHSHWCTRASILRKREHFVNISAVQDRAILPNRHVMKPKLEVLIQARLMPSNSDARSLAFAAMGTKSPEGMDRGNCKHKSKAKLLDHAPIVERGDIGDGAIPGKRSEWEGKKRRNCGNVGNANELNLKRSSAQ